ncbi:hypothetical protein ACFT5B_00835 [Luteimicrobium sp. NPDC057192]|uniref:hypothetical protein n=1 Tax=Luteimicrobium sp. NPDC057192 TaxID=3346042 RepID=UPI0036391284
MVVSQDGRYVTEPPAGTTYTAISGAYALRSDGVLGDLGGNPAPCTAAFTPGSGLRYTAVSAHGEMARWAALRSDGAYVYCDGQEPEDVATVVTPPTGTRFVGIDTGRDDFIAATDDGRVIASDGVEKAAAPEGRSIISLTAMDDGEGAAALDDGTILTWGLSSRDAALPAVPSDRAVFSAVGGDTGHAIHWALMVGDAIPVDVAVNATVPADRTLRVADTARFDVTATLPDGTPADGIVSMDVRAPDGRTSQLRNAGAFGGVGEVLFSASDHELPGTYGIDATFFGSPFVTRTVSTSLDFAEPSPVAITASGPSSWPATSNPKDTMCLDLATADGSPRWWPHDELSISVDGQTKYGYTSTGIDRTCLDELGLPPGSYTVRAVYEGWGDADAASWAGDVVVQPASATKVANDLPASWRYGQMPDTVKATVTSDGRSPVGIVHLNYTNGTQFGSGANLDATGQARLWLGSEDELVPGRYTFTTVYEGGQGFAPSRLDRPVTVMPALFTAATASVAGTPKVGQTLSAVPGMWSPTPTGYRYVWKANGVTLSGATSSRLTVPASAAGKRITVTITGLKQYYESSVTSAPTATVAPGTFTAPRPKVTGTAKVGKTLTVSRGAWAPTPSTITYVWKANGVTIATRTTSAFVVPASARGKRLTVTVTGSRTGYTKASATSAATIAVAPGTFVAPRPKVTGTVRVGRTLTVSRGTWSPTPSSIRYVWRANGLTIATRTTARFVVPSRARGKHLTVTVTGYRSGYTTRSVTSYRTGAVR